MIEAVLHVQCERRPQEMRSRWVKSTHQILGGFVQDISGNGVDQYVKQVGMKKKSRTWRTFPTLILEMLWISLASLEIVVADGVSTFA